MSVMNGDGDAICYRHNRIWVNYYLNRENGEHYRAMTIDGFKDTKFAYEIVGYNGMFTTETKYFETYADAEKYLGELIQKAYEFLKKFDLSVLTERGGFMRLDEAIVGCMGNEYPRIFLIDIMMKMINDDIKLKPDKPGIDTLQICIDQCVVPEK